MSPDQPHITIEVAMEYVRQIRAATDEALAYELLMEFGAKTRALGQYELVDQLARFVGKK